MKIFAGLLALLIGIAGWYYLFYSTAARRLGIIEDPAVNLRRHRLRQTNGLIMVILAAMFYTGFFAIDDQQFPRTYLTIWFVVFLLLLGVVALAVADLRLTQQLRRKR